MGTLVYVCPTTGHQVSTGVEVDRSSFKSLPRTKTAIFCPRCHKNHLLSRIWAWLDSNVPEGPLASDSLRLKTSAQDVLHCTVTLRTHCECRHCNTISAWGSSPPQGRASVPISSPGLFVVGRLADRANSFFKSGREVTDCDSEVVLPIHSLMAAWSAVKAIS